MWYRTERHFPYRKVMPAYDSAAAVYSRQYSVLPETEQAWLDDATTAVRVDAPVIEAGCGNGLVARYLHKKGMSVVGTDLSAGMLRVAREALPTGTWAEADVVSLPFPTDSFSVYVAWYSLIHLSDNQLDRAIQEAARVLRIGGVCALAIHESWRDSSDDRRVCGGSIATKDFMGTRLPLGFRLFRTDQIQRVLCKGGFLIEKVLHRDQCEANNELPTSRLGVIARKPR
jgi:ubiquinone/menaquinone biosynthesis C-methylase UbiE